MLCMRNSKTYRNMGEEEYYIWLGMKNDYRTLIGLEGVTVVDIPTDIDDDENDE
jgi:hypothetical protein